MTATGWPEACVDMVLTLSLFGFLALVAWLVGKR